MLKASLQTYNSDGLPELTWEPCSVCQFWRCADHIWHRWTPQQCSSGSRLQLRWPGPGSSLGCPPAPFRIFSENKRQTWKTCLSHNAPFTKCHHFFEPKMYFFGASFSYIGKNSVFSPFPNRREHDQSWRRRETCLERGSAISLLLVLEAKIGIRFFADHSFLWMKLVVKDLQKQMHSFWNLYYK